MLKHSSMSGVSSKSTSTIRSGASGRQTRKIKFGVIAVDYERHVPRNGAKEGLLSLLKQTHGNYQVFLCHDGPKETPYEKEFDLKPFGDRITTLQTDRRRADWGHSSRDLAMRHAHRHSDCDYYIQFNVDNLFLPFAFEAINHEINESNSGVVIFSVEHNKLKKGVGHPKKFSGVPPYKFNIDCMQLVAHREIWNRYGFWYDRHEQSDGAIYQRMCAENDWTNIDDVLGVNR